VVKEAPPQPPRRIRRPGASLQSPTPTMSGGSSTRCRTAAGGDRMTWEPIQESKKSGMNPGRDGCGTISPATPRTAPHRPCTKDPYVSCLTARRSAFARARDGRTPSTSGTPGSPYVRTPRRDIA
jgi:hypothetical protein